MRRTLVVATVAVALLPSAGVAQGTMDEVRWFRSQQQDAAVARSHYVSADFYHQGFEVGSYRYLSALVGLAVSPRFEVDIGVSYFTPSSDFIGSSSGMTDPIVHAKYNFGSGPTRWSAGGFFTAPVGSEDIGEGDMDAGIFLAARHPLGERTVIGGRISADYFEFTEDGSDPSFRFAGGVIQSLSPRLALLGELLVQSGSVTTADLTGGVDFALNERSHIRGAAGIGLNDNSPDHHLILGVFHYFRD